MDDRWLGELRVGVVGFGAMVLSPGLYGPVDRRAGGAALLCAIDCGSSLIDTSDGYGGDSHNERLIGSALVGAPPRR